MKTWLARKMRLKQLGHDKHTLPFSIDRELEILFLGKENIDDIKRMVHTPGWEILSSLLMEMAEQYRGKIINAAGDIEHNKTEMVSSFAIQYVANKILSLVNKTLAEEQTVEREIKRIKGSN